MLPYCFLLSYCRLLILDTAGYACEKADDNTFNIKQQSCQILMTEDLSL